MNAGVAILCLYAVFSLTSMAGMNLAFGVVAGLACAVLFRNARLCLRELFGLREFRQYLLFGGGIFATCLLSLMMAAWDPYSYAGHAPEITPHGFLKIWYLLAPGILAIAFAGLRGGRDRALQAVLRCWWATVVPLGAIAVIQFYTGWPHAQVVPTYLGHFHATLFFGHHLSTSSILIFPAFTALAVAFGRWKRKGEISALPALAGISGVLTLYLSYARTAWLAIPLGLVLIFARYLKPKVFASCTLILIAIGAGLSQTRSIQERMQSFIGVRDRVQLWKANLDFFQHRPFTGIGWLKTQEMSEFYFKEKFPDSYHDYFWGHAHNNVLEMLGGTGILGTLAFLLWTGFTLAFAWRTRKLADACREETLSDVAGGILIALLLLHFNGLTNVTFWEGKVMHQQMLGIGLLLMIQLTLRSKERSVSPQ